MRWVGGYGRMDSADAAPTRAPKPTRSARRRGAIKHLNEDHADALLVMAQALGGYPDAETARCTAADRYGLDLTVGTPRGTRAGPRRLRRAGHRAAGLRGATVELTRRARARRVARPAVDLGHRRRRPA